MPELSPLTQAVLFILDTLAGFFCIVLLLRFFMQAFRVSFQNQIGTFVIQITNWLILPIRKLTPRIGSLDWASLIAALLPHLIITSLSVYLVLSPYLPWAGHSMGDLVISTLLRSLVATFKSCLHLFIGLMIIQAVFSWVNPYPLSPLPHILRALTDPILKPIRRLIPPVSGIDLSPAVVLILAQAILLALRQY